MNITNCTFTNNKAMDQGGSIKIGASNEINIKDSIFKNNVADSGGAIYYDCIKDDEDRYPKCVFKIDHEVTF